MDIWEPELGEKRQLKREPSNMKDINAVAVLREWAGIKQRNTNNREHKSDVHPNQIATNDEVVGRVPRLMGIVVFFEARNKLWPLKVTGKRVNGGAGYGLPPNTLCLPIFWR